MINWYSHVWGFAVYGESVKFIWEKNWTQVVHRLSIQSKIFCACFPRDECGEFPLPSHCWDHGRKQKSDKWEREHREAEPRGPGRQWESSKDWRQRPPAEGLPISHVFIGISWLKGCQKRDVSTVLFKFPSPLQEANSINKSLSALGDVISALSSELPHVPYRNSKLTQVILNSYMLFEWLQMHLPETQKL